MSNSNEKSNGIAEMIDLLMKDQRSLVRRLATRDVCAAYQSLGYAEVMEELCEAAAQEMGFTEPLTMSQRKAVLSKAFDNLGVPHGTSLVERARMAFDGHNLFSARMERHSRRRKEHSRNNGARRRAQKHGVSFEQFTRAEIVERDQSTCYLCGRIELTDEEIHLDHVVPLARGGAHTRDNVRVSCATCNLKKGARLLDEIRVKSPLPDSG